MVDHKKPVIWDNLDYVIFHIDTNNVPSEKSAKDIAKSTVDLAMLVKLHSCDVSVFSITVGKDKDQIKVKEVNDHLSVLFKGRKIVLFDHSKSIKSKHLNKTRLHLTRRGTRIRYLLMISETKIVDSFPNGKFLIKGFSDLLE